MYANPVKLPENYTGKLENRIELNIVRIRQHMNQRPTMAPNAKQRFETAIKELTKLKANIIPKGVAPRGLVRKNALLQVASASAPPEKKNGNRRRSLFSRRKPVVAASSSTSKNWRNVLGIKGGHVKPEDIIRAANRLIAKETNETKQKIINNARRRGMSNIRSYESRLNPNTQYREILGIPNRAGYTKSNINSRRSSAKQYFTNKSIVNRAANAALRNLERYERNVKKADANKRKSNLVNLWTKKANAAGARPNQKTEIVQIVEKIANGGQGNMNQRWYTVAKIFKNIEQGHRAVIENRTRRQQQQQQEPKKKNNNKNKNRSWYAKYKSLESRLQGYNPSVYAKEVKEYNDEVLELERIKKQVKRNIEFSTNTNKTKDLEAKLKKVEASLERAKEARSRKTRFF